MCSRRARAALAALLLILAAPPARAQGAPVLAAEDTIPVPSAMLPEFVVRAPRATLDEILQRVARGEARRDSLMQDQEYTRLVLVTYLEERGPARHEVEEAARVYKRRPDRVREVPLRRRREGGKQDSGNVRVTTSADMGEQLVSFAFEPRARAAYRFRIADRLLVGGHVIYVVEFAPRSSADALPTGRAWIDTNDFVIVREEFAYRDRSPAPLLFTGIDRCVIERTLVDGRWWVVQRVVGRARLTSMVRVLGRLGGSRLPPAIDFAIRFANYRVNRGIPDSVFAEERR